jgi:hypothetical protein
VLLRFVSLSLTLLQAFKGLGFSLLCILAALLRTVSTLSLPFCFFFCFSPLLVCVLLLALRALCILISVFSSAPLFRRALFSLICTRPFTLEQFALLALALSHLFSLRLGMRDVALQVLYLPQQSSLLIVKRLDLVLHP